MIAVLIWVSLGLIGVFSVAKYEHMSIYVPTLLTLIAVGVCLGPFTFVGAIVWVLSAYLSRYRFKLLWKFK